jgi:hypothetical protein
MKTYNLEMHKHKLLNTPTTNRWGPGINVFVVEMLAILGALAVAISVILMSIWLATLDIKPLLGAGTWAVAFIFFALAFDKRGAAALLLAITGAALVVLAWLQNTMTADYVIVSGVLLATWIAVAVFKQFKTR